MKLTAVIALLAIGCGASIAQNYCEFNQAFDFQIGSATTQARAAGQLIGSPAPDVVCTQGSTTILVVDLDVPSGPVLLSLTAPSVVQSAAVADVDGDGTNEIIVGRNNSTGIQSGVSIFRSNGAGSFTRTDLTSSPAFLTKGRVSVADVTGDGQRDIIWGPRVFPNVGGGNFGASSLVSATVPTSASIEPGDLDGDGDIDLVAHYVVTGTSSNYFARVLRNNGAGVFTTLNQVNIGGGVVQGFVRIGDFTNDGRADVLMIGRNGFDVMKARVFAGTASAALSIQPLFESCAQNLAGPATADFDGDGALDFAAVIRDGDAQIMLFAGSGTGTLLQSSGPGTNHASTSSAAAECIAADFDADGDVDLAYVTDGSQPPRLRVFSNVSNQPSGLAVQLSGPTSPTYGIPAFGQISRQVTVELVDGAGGTSPARSHWVHESVTAIGNPPTLSCDSPNVGSNGAGRVTRAYDITPGLTAFTVTSSIPEGDSLSTLYIVNPTISIISGAGQVICAGDTTPAPIVVEVTSNGVAIPGASVEFELVTASAVSPTFIPSKFAVTDALGRAQAFVSSAIPASQPIRAVIRSTGGFVFASPNIAFSAQGPVTATIVSGNNQVAGWPDVYSEPLVAEFRGCTGEPLVGANVIAAVSGNASPTTTANAIPPITDANGRASFVVQRYGNAPDFTVTLFLANGNVGFGNWPVTFNLKTRNLTATSTATTLTMNYRHLTPAVPLLFVVDLANGMPPTGISTPFGPIYTSILAPSPNLIYSDGLGIFGTPDPTLITGPTGDWSSVFSRPVPPIGVTFTAQIYGYDASYPDIFDAYFVSNWANFTL